MKKILTALVIGILTYIPTAWAQTISIHQIAFDLKNELFEAQLNPQNYQQSIFELARSQFDIGSYPERLSTAVSENNISYFAYLRAAVWTDVLYQSYLRTVEAIKSGDFDLIEDLALIREFRPATRYSFPDTESARILKEYKNNEAELEKVLSVYEVDLIGTYQNLLNLELQNTLTAYEKGFYQSMSYSIGLSEGYFNMLSDKYERQFDTEKLSEMKRVFADLSENIRNQNFNSIPESIASINKAMEGFVAVPLSNQELQKKAGQMERFLQLIPIEYKRGVKNGEVFIDIELQEAVTFYGAARVAFNDLKPYLEEQNDTTTTFMESTFKELGEKLEAANRRSKVVDPDLIASDVTDLRDSFAGLVPGQWLEAKGADFDIIYSILQQIDEAIKNGDYENAELKRLEAYGLFELGPELRLMAFDSGMALKIESKFWQGQKDEPGLATVINREASPEEAQAAIGRLKMSLVEAEKLMGKGQSALSTMVNSAIIVFREGLEAILIVFALLAGLSFRDSTKKYRRSLVAGVIAGLLASIITWVIVERIIFTFIGFGEKLEAVVSLIAIAVLLLITNWFFHNTYWNKWNMGLQKRKHKLIRDTREETENRARLFGFFLLGLSSVYREGFETVLFLQVLVLDSGIGIVMQGLLFGSILLAIVGFITFKLQKHLPYLKMLIVTGFLIVTILVTMVGHTVHTLQTVGWLGITPISGLDLPFWLGLWFGIYATWEGILIQIATLIFVGGSYLLAEHIQKRRTGWKFKSIREKLFG